MCNASAKLRDWRVVFAGVTGGTVTSLHMHLRDTIASCPTVRMS